VTAPPVEVVDASRRFGRAWALRRVSVRFEAASCTLVLGPNGAGKSTLLALCAGQLRPTEGTVRAFGYDLDGHPDRVGVRRRLGVLLHAAWVYPDLTGRENLALFAGLYDRRPEFDPILAEVGLDLAAERPARTYSRGMLQRLALGRLLVQAPEVWLLDEPTTGLDTAGLELFRGLVRRAIEAGATLVVVTHDPKALGDLPTRTLELAGGRVRAS
jgi:ABC-type multidrug transport system ATPase subunit